MKIYVLKSTSNLASGILEQHFSTRAAANIEAAARVNIVREEIDMPGDATADDWEAKCLEMRQHVADESDIDLDDMEDDDAADVWIDESYLQGFDDTDGERWRALMSSERIRVVGYAGMQSNDDLSISIKEPGHLHFSVEFWDKYRSTLPRFPEVTGRNILTAYADHLRKP